MTTPGATEAVTPPTPEEIAYVLYDAVRHMRPAEARAEIAKQLREAEVNALRRAPEQAYLGGLDDRLHEVKIIVMRMSDGSKPGALIAEAVQKTAALRNDLFAIRSLLPKEEGK